MKLIKNHKGIGLPVVIGIVTFVLALGTSLFTVTVNQARLIKKSVEYTETYANNIHDINSAISVIESDSSILEDTIKLAELSDLFDVNLVQSIDSKYWIISNQSVDPQLTSYFQLIEGIINQDFDTFFDFDFDDDGTSDGVVLNDFVIPTDTHVDAATSFYNSFILDNNINPIVTTTFAEIASHSALTLSASPKIYINSEYSSLVTTTGSGKNRRTTITIPENTILVYNGSLAFPENTTFKGVAIINGDLNSGTNLTINGTLYVDGEMNLGIKLGTYGNIEPTFFFADTVDFGNGNVVNAYSLYIFANRILFMNKTEEYDGGFFASNPISVNGADTSFVPITIDLETLGLPSDFTIELEQTGSGESSIIGIKSTYPRKE